MRLIEKVRLAASRPPRRLVGGLRRHLIYANQMAIPGRAARSVYGPRLLKRPGDITFYLCVSGAYGPMIPEIIGAMPAPFVFLDIGANIGLFSLIAASHGHCERVVAIEPIPETIDLLKGNFALNRAADRATVIAGAVADTSRPTVSMRCAPGHSGASMVADDGDIDVPVVRETQIDHALDGTTGPILAKVDVEYSEPDVLAVLRQSRHYDRIGDVIMEVVEERQTEASATARRMLEEDGFAQVRRSSDLSSHDAYFKRAAGRAL